MTLVKIYVEIYESIVPRAAPLMEAEAFIFAFGTRQIIKKNTRNTTANWTIDLKNSLIFPFWTSKPIKE